MRSSVEEIVALIQQQGGNHLFQAEDDSLVVIEDFQSIYDLLLDMEYQGLIRITGRNREDRTGYLLVDQITVQLLQAAHATGLPPARSA